MQAMAYVPTLNIVVYSLLVWLNSLCTSLSMMEKLADIIEENQMKQNIRRLEPSIVVLGLPLFILTILKQIIVPSFRLHLIYKVEKIISYWFEWRTSGEVLSNTHKNKI